MKIVFIQIAALLLLKGAECGSQATRRRSPPPPPPPSSQIEFDCPEEFGYYAHPTDCTQYYVCVFGGALLESCTGGLMYSHELQTCDWPRNVGCSPGSNIQQQPQQQQKQERKSQRIQQTQNIPKHDLYTEEEQIGPAEEFESDRQQRVYRGQPSTIGQVASDRDAISTHSNAIPVQPSNGREKLSVVSYGTQQQYTRFKRLKPEGDVRQNKADHNFVTNTTRSRVKRQSRSNEDGVLDINGARPISWSSFQPRILHQRRPQPQPRPKPRPQYYYRSPTLYPQNMIRFEPSDAQRQPLYIYRTTPRIVNRPTIPTQAPTLLTPTYAKANQSTQNEDSEEEYDEEYEDDDYEDESEEDSNERLNSGPNHSRESTERPYTSHEHSTKSNQNNLTHTSTQRYPKQLDKTRVPYIYTVEPTKFTTPKPESDEEYDEYYDEDDDYEEFDNSTHAPKTPKVPKKLQNISNSAEDYEDSDEYYDDSEEDEADTKGTTKYRATIKTEKSTMEQTTPSIITTKFEPRCMKGRKCAASVRYRSTTQATPSQSTKPYRLYTNNNKSYQTSPLPSTVAKKLRQKQNRKPGVTDASVTKNLLSKGQTQRALTRMRASVTPQQQAYIEQQTLPPRSYNQSRYIPSQYETPYYNVYEDDGEIYKQIDYPQYTTNNQYSRTQYKEKQPQIEIVPRDEPAQKAVTYSKNKYSSQSDVYQTVTPQEYDAYAIQDNEDVQQYRQPQKSSGRSGVKENVYDERNGQFSTKSPEIIQNKAKTETSTRTLLTQETNNDFLIKIPMTPPSPSPFKVNQDATTKRLIQTVDITPRPRIRDHKIEIESFKDILPYKLPTIRPVNKKENINLDSERLAFLEKHRKEVIENINREKEAKIKEVEKISKIEPVKNNEDRIYYQTQKASSRFPNQRREKPKFRIVVEPSTIDFTLAPPTTSIYTDKPPKKYLNTTTVARKDQTTDLPVKAYTDQIRKTLDTPIPSSGNDKTQRVKPTTYDTQSIPGLSRGSSRHRGSVSYTASPNEEPSNSVSSNRGTPASRGRPTLKPSNSVIAKASDYIDIFRNPPYRPSNVYPTPQVDKTAAKCRKDVCLLPDCSCGGKDIPGDLSPEETPQIVLLTFDDSVNDLNKGLYSDLFDKGRVNPNGCPISATFYVSHEWTDYSQVQNLYSAGHEIASHSVSHSFGEQFSQRKWTREIAGQREILSAYGGVKLEDVRGMRAPFLSVGGNKMFKMLYDSNFTYDSSMPVYENRPPSWPYTLDYKLFHDCMIPPCPTRSYPGVWEVPMVMWQDLNGGRCSMGDACSNPPNSEGVYKMLIKNFERHFTTNRSPFGLFYHAAWFTQPHHKEGFIAFLDTINKMPEVWLVTNWQAIQWQRDPTPISRLNNFAPFQCNYQGRPKKCNNPKVCNLWHKSGVRYMRTCQPCPDVYPWTGKSGVKNSRVDNEVIQE